MMIHLHTCDFDKWLAALDALRDRGGAWTVSASVYSSYGNFGIGRVGCRAAMWLPMGRELLIYDEYTEAPGGSADAQDAGRDYLARCERIESHCKKVGVRYLPLLLQWFNSRDGKGGAA